MFTSYEKLLCEYEEEVQIKETNLSHGFKGLYYDGHILIDSSLTETEKYCILAEEIGHHFTSSGNIIDQNKCTNRQQEASERLGLRKSYSSFGFSKRSNGLLY